jgi:LysM domain
MSVAISDDNMYQAGYIANFGDEQLLVRQQLKIVPQVGDKWHTVTVGDKLDAIAYRYYKDIVPNGGNYWWVIADANNILNPFNLDIFVGQFLLIPNLLGVQRLIDEFGRSLTIYPKIGTLLKVEDIDSAYSVFGDLQALQSGDGQLEFGNGFIEFENGGVIFNDNADTNTAEFENGSVEFDNGQIDFETDN